MGRVILGILMLSLLGSAEIKVRCSRCTAGKEKLRCDYYVGQKGEKSHQDQCRIYAEYVDVDGAHAKAARYYLLAGDPGRAMVAARKALEQGQEYGREFLAIALWIEGRRDEALEEMARFKEHVPGHDYLQRDLKEIGRLYPEAKLELSPL